MKIIIIGGVAGGASAAARLRRLDETAEITMYERSGYISYANCGLPYYLGEVITDREELTLQTPDSFHARFRVNVKVRHQVTAIHPDAKTVTVQNLDTGESFTDTYDKLLLSPGAKAVRPPLPGIDSDGIFTLRTVEDALAIYDRAKAAGAGSALVLGGGFVGLEAAENLSHLGLSVTLAEAAPQVLSILDADMAAQVHSLFRKNGISLYLNTRAEGFEKADGKILCTLSNGQKITADLVLLAMGVTPDSHLAQDAGLQTGQKGSIAVNDKMETSVPDIYAVGDAVEITHFVTGKKTLIPLAGPANKQGRIAADNMTGKDSRYTGTQGSSVIKLFNRTAAATGINERQAQAAGIPYDKVILSPASHAGYYPGGMVMTMKVLFEKETFRLLGAQIIGFDGVDKRIDVLATAIRAGMKGYELPQLELAYAPPYSSAKDPVNMAGFMMENLRDGLVRQFGIDEIATLPQDGSVFLLDSRTPGEYAAGHAPGFINIPVDSLRERMTEIPKHIPVYIMCQSGLRSYLACRILTQNGYSCYNFTGGYRYYAMAAEELLPQIASYSCGMDKKCDKVTEG